MSRICIIELDRVQFNGWPRTPELPEFPGFEVLSDIFVRPQTKIQIYRRVRTLKSRKTGTEIYVQYKPACPWLAPAKATVVPKDGEGLRRVELDRITGVFNMIRLLTGEVSFDFPFSSGIGRAYVLSHAIFGKSRPAGKRRSKNLRRRARRAATIARSYKKPNIGSYRVELELHSSWLRAHGLNNLDDLTKLARLLFPNRIKFVRIDWESLSAYLLRKRLNAEKIISQLRLRAGSIYRVLDFLRSEVGIRNVHRFLKPLEINHVVQRELRAWSKRWNESATQKTGENGCRKSNKKP